MSESIETETPLLDQTRKTRTVLSYQQMRSLEKFYTANIEDIKKSGTTVKSFSQVATISLGFTVLPNHISRLCREIEVDWPNGRGRRPSGEIDERITSLEKQVAELKQVVEDLRPIL